MNYNDINTRLERIYESINSMNRYGGEVLSGVHTEHRKEADGKSVVIISFGRETETTNRVQNVINNLANLKDILKENIAQQGKDSRVIENEINQSMSLQLVLDLSNQEKHGYPLTKTQRSGKNPQITNIRSGLSPSDKPDNVKYSASTGAAAYNVMIVVSADIVDSNGHHLLTLDELVNSAIDDWENMIRRFQLT